MDRQYVGNRQANAEALALFKQAIELDNSFTRAYAAAALCYYLDVSYGWRGVGDDLREGLELANRAIELGRDDATALGFGAIAMRALTNDRSRAAALAERSVQLNPNFAQGWQLAGWSKISRGEHELAIQCFERAMRLSPLDPFAFQNPMGMAYACLLLHRDGSLFTARVCEGSARVRFTTSKAKPLKNSFSFLRCEGCEGSEGFSMSANAHVRMRTRARMRTTSPRFLTRHLSFRKAVNQSNVYRL